MVVSDNLKSGITKSCFYEPAVNRTYAEMAAHYDTAVVPARTAALRIPPAPVGQQEPPARAAASDSWRSLRDARGALRLTTRTACRRDKQQEDNILRQDARSWHEGYRAGLRGTSLTERPYPAGSTETGNVERLYPRQGRPAREGRTSCLTRPANTEISTSIQRCPHAPTPHCSRSIGMPDRDASEQVIAIAGMRKQASKQARACHLGMLTARSEAAMQ